MRFKLPNKLKKTILLSSISFLLILSSVALANPQKVKAEETSSSTMSNEAMENTIREDVVLEDLGPDEDPTHTGFGGEGEGIQNIMRKIAATQGLIKFNGNLTQTLNLYNNSTGGGNSTYLSASVTYSGIVPYYDHKDGRYKITISGAEGWVDEKHFQKSELSSKISQNHFRVSNGELIFYLARDFNSNSFAPTSLGKAPSYLKSGVRYYSVDGHYFYTNLQSMISDLREGTNKSAINAKSPFYNYFQYASYRIQSNIPHKEIDDYLHNTRGYNSRPDRNPANLTKNQSQLFDTAQTFESYGKAYGTNPWLSLAIAINESGWGRSHIAVSKNNLFGHNAYDSFPEGASGYPKVEDSIESHSIRFLNWNYLDSDPNNGNAFGAYPGDKNSGMNVKYSSDPFWGMKAAEHYHNLDQRFGSKDLNKERIGIIKNASVVNLRKEANTTSASPYATRRKGQAVWILGEVKGESVNGSNIWYKVGSDSLLRANKDLMDIDKSSNHPDGENRRANYDYKNNHLYIHSSYVEEVGGKPIPQFPKGDVNGDGKVSAFDYILIRNHIMGSQKLKGDELYRADVDGNGKISAYDYVLVRNIIMGR